MREKLKKELNKLSKTGFFSIFLSSVFSKVLVFIGGTIIVRIISKTDYGIYTYVLNCMAMLMILNDFGASTAALQFLTEEKDNVEERNKYFKYTMKITLVSSLVSSILIFLSPYFYPFKIEEAKTFTPILCLVPIISNIGNLFAIILRVNLDNKRYAILQIFSTFASYLFLITFSYFWGLNGAISSQYIYYFTVLLFSLFLSLKYIRKYKTKKRLTKERKSSFLKFSIANQINNTISGLLIVVDTFIIGLIISDPDIIATYKVGSTIPHALTFISTCVAIYIVPYFIKNNKNKKWLRSNLKKILLYGTLGYGLMFGSIILLANFIIGIVYGSNYSNSVSVFIILMIGLFFTSAYKIPCANMLQSMKKVKINIIVNVTAVFLNAILNVIFINKFGFVGAAITTTIINIFVSLIYMIYLFKNLKDVGEFKND